MSPEDLGIPMVFIYRDPRLAFLSMRGRGVKLLHTNYMKINSLTNDTTYTDPRMLESMLAMFKKWTSEKHDVLVIEYSTLALDATKQKLADHIKRPLAADFTWREPKVHHGDLQVRRMFDRYKEEINKVLTHSKKSSES